jgi:hypothetical protein
MVMAWHMAALGILWQTTKTFAPSAREDNTPQLSSAQLSSAQDKKSNNLMITKLELQSMTIKIEQISKPLGHHCQSLTASKSLPALTINPLQLISAETDQIAG